MRNIFLSIISRSLQGIILVIFVVLILSPGSLAQTSESSIILKGLVIDKRDSTVIPNVHIINLNRIRGTTSGSDGSFSILVNKGDSILFQAVGFITDTLAVNTEILNSEKIVIVPLRDKTYQLPTVDVYPYATFAEFKHAFLNFEDPEPPLDLQLPPAEFQPDPGDAVGLVIPGPITALYERFSRRGREMAKFKEITDEAELARRASRVVNPEVIKRLTGIEDEQEYYIFLDFCNMSYEYIVNTKDYLVYQRIIRCYEQYAGLKP